jgi:hypothetical protein
MKAALQNSKEIQVAYTSTMELYRHVSVRGAVDINSVNLGT